MTCAYCGTELPASALFCGECGRSLAAPTRRPVPVADTAIIDAVELAEIDGATVVTRSTRATAGAEPAPPVSEPAPPVVEPAETVVPEAALVEVQEAPVAPILDPWKPPARLLRPTPAPPVEDDVEKTRIVSSTQSGQRFVLQFSTGESVTVFGTGLVGRNPVKEPAEYFDHMVTIVDPGKSVSKTHLEFGQIGTSFWVADRFSGNGTTIREPDSPARRCEPGRRYRIARGTRVTIGEQFFVVS